MATDLRGRLGTLDMAQWRFAITWRLVQPWLSRAAASPRPTVTVC